MSVKTNLQRLILSFIYGKKVANIDDLVSHIESAIDTKEQSGEEKRKVKSKYVINRTLKTLEKSGMIDTYESSHSTFARLAPSGRQKLRSMNLDESNMPLPTTWDGKWRMIILDLPEDKKSERNALRYILKKAQFAKLKNSIWISPFPFEHMLENMKEDLGLSNELLIIVTDQIDNQTAEIFFERYTH